MLRPGAQGGPVTHAKAMRIIIIIMIRVPCKSACANKNFPDVWSVRQCVVVNTLTRSTCAQSEVCGVGVSGCG